MVEWKGQILEELAIEFVPIVEPSDLYELARGVAGACSDRTKPPNDLFFRFFNLGGLDNRSLYVLIRNDRPTRELAHADPKTDGKAGRRGWPKVGGTRCGSGRAPPR
jgi:hypothetical protein